MKLHIMLRSGHLSRHRLTSRTVSPKNVQLYVLEEKVAQAGALTSPRSLVHAPEPCWGRCAPSPHIIKTPGGDGGEDPHGQDEALDPPDSQTQ